MNEQPAISSLTNQITSRDQRGLNTSQPSLFLNAKTAHKRVKTALDKRITPADLQWQPTHQFDLQKEEEDGSTNLSLALSPLPAKNNGLGL
jgi:hypothetical protein